MTGRAPGGDLIAWGIADAPLPEEPVPGDLHVVQSSANGTLIAVVDGVGHGIEAAEHAVGDLLRISVESQVFGELRVDSVGGYQQEIRQCRSCFGVCKNDGDCRRARRMNSPGFTVRSIGGFLCAIQEITGL